MSGPADSDARSAGDEVSIQQRAVSTWASDAAAINRSLGDTDPSWPVRTIGLAGGALALGGPGQYVNRLLGAGVVEPLGEDAVATVVRLSDEVGVPAVVEVSDVTLPATVEVLRRCGFEPDVGRPPVIGLLRPVRRALPDAPDDVLARSISPASLGEWLDLAAVGWGLDDAEARRVSDAYWRAASRIDRGGMVIAHDLVDGRALGCATLAIRDGVATLGGMSTIPTERRRGVQAALVRHRVAVAVESGCELVTTRAVAGEASLRNLLRLGFEPFLELRRWVRGSR